MTAVTRIVTKMAEGGFDCKSKQSLKALVMNAVITTSMNFFQMIVRENRSLEKCKCEAKKPGNDSQWDDEHRGTMHVHMYVMHIIHNACCTHTYTYM